MFWCAIMIAIWLVRWHGCCSRRLFRLDVIKHGGMRTGAVAVHSKFTSYYIPKHRESLCKPIPARGSQSHTRSHPPLTASAVVDGQLRPRTAQNTAEDDHVETASDAKGDRTIYQDGKISKQTVPRSTHRASKINLLSVTISALFASFLWRARTLKCTQRKNDSWLSVDKKELQQWWVSTFFFPLLRALYLFLCINLKYR
jgi:hypothetical protein